MLGYPLMKQMQKKTDEMTDAFDGYPLMKRTDEMTDAFDRYKDEETRRLAYNFALSYLCKQVADGADEEDVTKIMTDNDAMLDRAIDASFRVVDHVDARVKARAEAEKAKAKAAEDEAHDEFNKAFRTALSAAQNKYLAENLDPTPGSRNFAVLAYREGDRELPTRVVDGITSAALLRSELEAVGFSVPRCEEIVQFPFLSPNERRGIARMIEWGQAEIDEVAADSYCLFGAVSLLRRCRDYQV